MKITFKKRIVLQNCQTDQIVLLIKILVQNQAFIQQRNKYYRKSLAKKKQFQYKIK